MIRAAHHHILGSLTAIAIFVATAAPASAQISRVAMVVPGHFVRVDSLSAAEVQAHCLALGDELYTRQVREVGACHVVGLTNLSVAGGHQWSYATYTRSWLIPATAAAKPDTVGESEVVLFIRADTDTSRIAELSRTMLTPQWHYRYESDMLRMVTPEVTQASDGSALFAIDECVNGTGGCSQSFFAFRDGDWLSVRKLFVDSLDHRFPGQLQHGFHVDLATLHAEALLYAPGDGNCCASRIADMTLRLRQDALEIVTLRVRTTK